LRDGVEADIHRNYIKVGDIIKIKNGMDIPVDGVMIHGSGVQCDESAMTGESIHLIKENTEKCFQRKDEHEADMKGGDKDHHDVPSSVLLSGTQI